MECFVLLRDSKLPQRMIRSQVYEIQQRKVSDSAQILGNEMLKSSAMQRVLGVLVDGKLGWPHLGIVSRFGHQNIRKT